MGVIDKILSRRKAHFRAWGAERPALNPVYIRGDSPFTNALKKKCAEYGVEVLTGDEPRRMDCSIVVDTEQHPDYEVREFQDIDHRKSDGLSACAEGVLDILEEFNPAGKHVCIVGRGHAVLGLAETLLKLDSTVTVCHAKTEKLHVPMLVADFVVYAAPEITDDAVILGGRPYVVVDLSGAVKDRCLSSVTYFGPGDIGRLTTTILAERAYKWDGWWGWYRRKFLSEYREEKAMKVVELDPTFRDLVAQNDGYCPCAVEKNADTKCPCKEFRDQKTPGKCHCGRFEKI